MPIYKIANLNSIVLADNNRRVDRIESRITQASERQGIVPLNFLLSPVMAAAVPAAGAAAIAAYGSYGDEILRLYNSLFGE